MQRLLTSGLIKIYTVCHSVFILIYLFIIFFLSFFFFFFFFFFFAILKLLLISINVRVQIQGWKSTLLKLRIDSVKVYNVSSCSILQFVVVGYAEGKKIVINERALTMEISSSTAMGRFKLDQIIYIN